MISAGLPPSRVAGLRSSGPVAWARHLTVGYRGRPVWTDANFEIEPGEFVAVIGPNGAGKTTLFRLLLGLLHPAGGELEVFGEAPRRGNPRIGYVPQTHLVDRDTNVEAVQLVRLAFSANRWLPNLTPGQLRSERQATSAALRSVGASEIASKSLGAMSGGELQRIFLAEALVSAPDLLLLDEPLANLDIRRATELVELVHGQVQTRNVATLLVAHDINPLIRHLDKVIYIANGHVATGLPDEVLTSERLSDLYGVPIEVLRDSRGNLVIVGDQDAHQDPAA